MTDPEKTPEELEKREGGAEGTLNDEDDVVADIGSRLGSVVAEEKKDTSDKPKAEEPLAFDFEKLTEAQLQGLKTRLGVTPERATEKKGNARTFIRTIGGKYVVATKNAYLALVYDATRLSEVETHKIPVRFAGEDKYTDIIYTEFMAADRVPCEIVSMRQEVNHRIEGEVVSKETGKLINREATIVNYFFTIKLPDGTTVEVDGTASNA